MDLPYRSIVVRIADAGLDSTSVTGQSVGNHRPKTYPDCAL
jgi:hypothetical protein